MYPPEQRLPTGGPRQWWSVRSKRLANCGSAAPTKVLGKDIYIQGSTQWWGQELIQEWMWSWWSYTSPITQQVVMIVDLWRLSLKSRSLYPASAWKRTDHLGLCIFFLLVTKRLYMGMSTPQWGTQTHKTRSLCLKGSTTPSHGTF